MFTVEQCDALRERVLRLARGDARVVAGAAVGSLATEGGGDRFSDLDLTFGVAEGVTVRQVLEDWTRTLAAEQQALQLVDLERASTVYRVFLLPHALQFDLSLTPAADFRPAGPRFRLLFGEIAPAPPAVLQPGPPGSLAIPTPVVAADIFGWGVIYALHTRACIARGRLWQAEHYAGAVRDHALALACLRRGLPAAQARGYDDLPNEILTGFQDAHVGATQPETLTRALDAAIAGLLREGAQAQLPHAQAVAVRLG